MTNAAHTRTQAETCNNKKQWCNMDQYGAIMCNQQAFGAVISTLCPMTLTFRNLHSYNPYQGGKSKSPLLLDLRWHKQLSQVNPNLGHLYSGCLGLIQKWSKAT